MISVLVWLLLMCTLGVGVIGSFTIYYQGSLKGDIQVTESNKKWHLTGSLARIVGFVCFLFGLMFFSLLILTFLAPFYGWTPTY
jgi:hypothetical protein